MPTSARQDRTGTTEDLGEFAAAERAAVGIGTYKHAAYRNEYAKTPLVFWNPQ